MSGGRPRTEAMVKLANGDGDYHGDCDDDGGGGGGGDVEIGGGGDDDE